MYVSCYLLVKKHKNFSLAVNSMSTTKIVSFFFCKNIISNAAIIKHCFLSRHSRQQKKRDFFSYKALFSYRNKLILIITMKNLVVENFIWRFRFRRTYERFHGLKFKIILNTLLKLCIITYHGSWTNSALLDWWDTSIFGSLKAGLSVCLEKKVSLFEVSV